MIVREPVASINMNRRYAHMEMDNWTFGLTMIIVGMGGTILTLYILSLIMTLLRKACPYRKEEEAAK